MTDPPKLLDRARVSPHGTMIFLHVMQRGALGVKSPMDRM